MSPEMNMHHYMHPKREFSVDSIRYQIRTNPINIEQTTVEKHKELHYIMMGRMAIMGDNLCRELLDFYSDVPKEIKHSFELRRIWFDKQIDHLAELSIVRSGLVGKEASFWASNLDTQKKLIR